jgi:hypothetical protein
LTCRSEVETQPPWGQPQAEAAAVGSRLCPTAGDATYTPASRPDMTAAADDIGTRDKSWLQ